MNLTECIRQEFDDVRIIGVVNPSIIVRHGDVTFVFYENRGAGVKKYVMCCGDSRTEFDDPHESYGVLVNHYKKIRQAESYAEQSSNK